MYAFNIASLIFVYANLIVQIHYFKNIKYYKVSKMILVTTYFSPSILFYMPTADK